MKKAKWIGGIVTGVFTYLGVQAIKEYEAQRGEQEPIVVWITAEHEEETEEPEETKEDEEMQPLFHVGDEVLTFNPYEQDYVDFEEWTFTPIYYRVEGYMYDPVDGVYRYKLAGKENWHAENWLMFPEAPRMLKALVQVSPPGGMHQQLDDEEAIRKAEIDYLLLSLHDAVLRGNDEEAKKYEEELRKLTGEDE